MSLLSLAHHNVITIEPDKSVTEAAKLMAEKNIGSVVIAINENPVGILTDRDIVIRVIYRDLDPKTTQVRDVMSRNLVTLNQGVELFEALEVMKDKGLRRYPIVDADNKLSGFFSLDDVLYLLGLEMSAVARIIEP